MNTWCAVWYSCFSHLYSKKVKLQIILRCTPSHQILYIHAGEHKMSFFSCLRGQFWMYLSGRNASCLRLVTLNKEEETFIRHVIGVCVLMQSIMFFPPFPLSPSCLTQNLHFYYLFSATQRDFSCHVLQEDVQFMHWADFCVSNRRDEISSPGKRFLRQCVIHSFCFNTNHRVFRP